MAATVQDEARAAGRASRWAWGVCWLMFACTVLNYMNRQAMAVVGPQVKVQFGLDNVGFGWVLAAFQLTYAFFQWPAGFVVDRRDVRKTYAAAVAWWSLAGLATAFTPVLGLLLACRALLGMGESFNWPCGLRVTAGVLPAADRSLGNGIFNSGAAVGAVLTPLLIVPLAQWQGWRAPFVVLGLAGLVWVASWLLLTSGRRMAVATQGREPAAAGGGLSAGARRAFGLVVVLAAAVAAAGLRIGLSALWWGVAVLMFGPLVVARLMGREDLAGADWARSLGAVVRRRRFWIMAAVGITINVTWHFLVNWMGFFFQDPKGRNLGLLIGGMVIAVPFLAADAGNLAGGWLTRVLARGGRSPASARKIVLGACMVLMTCAVGVGIVVANRPVGPSGPPPDVGQSVSETVALILEAIRRDALVIGLLSLSALGAAAYMVNYFAFCQDVAPEHTGLVIGYLGGLGNLFAAGFLPLAGWISEGSRGFAPNFVIVGLLPLVGLVALLAAWGPETEAG